MALSPRSTRSTHHLASAVAIVAALLAAPSARAAPEVELDAETWTPITPGVVAPSTSEHQGALWVALAGTLHHAPSGSSAAVLLLAGIPLGRFAEPPRTRSARAPAQPVQPVPPSEPPPVAPAPPPSPPPPLRAPRVPASAARGAVAAALDHAGLRDASARVDGIATRARASALLPELRLRVARGVDEAESVVPTEYDPGRTTASGGTTLWLEGRATWRLDRLVFADDELALERLRAEREEARAKVAARALELLAAWQKAGLDAARAERDGLDDDLAVAELARVRAELALDDLTGGWFGAWLARRAR